MSSPFVEKSKHLLKRFLHFVWEEDSLSSWVVNIILAFVLIKFIIYPGLGFIVGTQFPIVAVVSGSMEHHPSSFSGWWDDRKSWYEAHAIPSDAFREFSLHNGLKKGDIVFIRGKKLHNIKIGDILVFRSKLKSEPIIHRIVSIEREGVAQEGGAEEQIYFTTKGDNNDDSYAFEHRIRKDQIIGVASFRIPYLGYLKIGFAAMLKLVGIG